MDSPIRETALPSEVSTASRWAFFSNPRFLVLVGVGIPTLMIGAIMAGFIGQVRQVAEFPYLSIDFGFPSLLTANTPTGGDMGAHVLVPAILRDSLLPDGRLVGWSNDWYAGFPALYFYFPLPALFTVLLDLLLPFGVAFKITASLGVIGLPAGAYVFVRGIGYSRIVAAVAAATASLYVFMESFSIYGGNIKSTMAGEFSFAWSLSLSLVYLGLLIRDTRHGGQIKPMTAVFLAATALSHLVTTIVVVLASLPIVAYRRGWKVLSASWLLGFAIAGAWALPFLSRALPFGTWTTDMGWTPVKGLVGGTFAPGTTATPFPNEFIPIAALALIGAVWALLRRDRVSVLLTMTLVPFVIYWLFGQEGFGFTAIYNGRFLPYWYLGCFILAGIAIGLGVTAVARWVPGRPQNLAVGVALSAIILVNLVVAGIHDVAGWVRWNYTGYEGKDVFGEYTDLMTSIDALPDGRVMWEANSDLGRYGTPMALMLIPYWSDGHPSMEGLLFESSLTTPFHFLNASEVSKSPSNPVRGLRYKPLNFERASEHLALYDVTYYVAWTDEAKLAASEYGLQLLVESPPFEVFALRDAAQVEVATRQPIVYDGEGFGEASLSWYDDIDNLDTWMVDAGPEDWPRVATVEGPYPQGRSLTESGVVSDVTVEDHRISFKTTAIGVPHLVKTSYFPNWRANGAEGPYRAAPSLMVVVPTESDVVLEFSRSWAENIGVLLSVTSIGGLVYLAGRKRLGAK